MSQLVNIEVQNLNHLGIIAGIIDEIGIVEIINEQLGIKPQEKLNSGIIVKSLILNAMGFVSRPLYLFPQFFNDKATEHLFGSGILPEYFNDDKIGRVMDKLYKFGLNKIFFAIALAACKKYGLDNKYSHLDSTSISLQGDYEICQTVTSENLEPTPIKIVHGYSKDKRPDLKQFLINLIASGDSGVPLFLECGNGNDNDKAKFAQLLSNFKKMAEYKMDEDSKNIIKDAVIGATALGAGGSIDIPVVGWGVQTTVIFTALATIWTNLVILLLKKYGYSFNKDVINKCVTSIITTVILGIYGKYILELLFLPIVGPLGIVGVVMLQSFALGYLTFKFGKFCDKEFSHQELNLDTVKNLLNIAPTAILKWITPGEITEFIEDFWEDINFFDNP